MDMADFIPLVAKLTGEEKKQFHTKQHKNRTQPSSILTQGIRTTSTIKTASGKVTECELSVYLWLDSELQKKCNKVQVETLPLSRET